MPYKANKFRQFVLPSLVYLFASAKIGSLAPTANYISPQAENAAQKNEEVAKVIEDEPIKNPQTIPSSSQETLDTIQATSVSQKEEANTPTLTTERDKDNSTISIQTADETTGNTTSETPSDRSRTETSQNHAIDETSSASEDDSMEASQEQINQIETLMAKAQGELTPEFEQAKTELLKHANIVDRIDEEAEELNKVGLKYLRLRRFSLSTNFFKRAAIQNKEDPKYLSNMSYSEMLEGDLASALKHIYKSLSISPNRPVAWGNLGMTLAKAGNYDRAIQAFIVSYRLSNGDTKSFLVSLSTDEDTRLQKAGLLTLKSLGLNQENK